MYLCFKPTPNPVEAAIYFCSFTVVVSLVMLSLFVGVVTMSMKHSMDEMRHEVEHNKKRLRELRNVEEINQIVATANAVLTITGGSLEPSFRFRRQKSSDVVGVSSGTSTSSYKGPILVRKTIKSRFRKSMEAKLRRFLPQHGTRISLRDSHKLRTMKEMSLLLMQAWSGSKISRSLMNMGVENEDVDKNSITYMARSIAIKANNVVDSTYFNIIMTVIIVGAAVLVGFEADNINPPDDIAEIFTALDYTILAIFIVEILLRIAAEEFNLFEYFGHIWNIIDFLIVCVSQIPGGGVYLTVVR